ALGRGRARTGYVDGDEAAANVEEAVHCRAILKIPDDLSRVIDATGRRTESARHVELAEAAACVEETVAVCLVGAKTKIPDDLPRSINAIRHRERHLTGGRGRGGRVDGGEAAANFEEAVRYRAVLNMPDDLSRV